jgi:phenylalanyl-tRNA synthetase beta subunit
LPRYCAGFELSLDELLPIANTTSQYTQLPRFPKIEQDICLRVPASVSYQELFQFVWEHLETNRPDQTYQMLGPVDIYQRDGETDYKQITLRLSIASYERTLVTEEVNKLLEAVATAAHDQFAAERV